MFTTDTDVSTQGKRALDPIERISEFLFGLIMVLTLTCSLNVSGVNRGSVRTMLLEALGCNVAWGIIDAFFYLLNSVGQRGQGSALLGRLRRTVDPREACGMVAEALPPLVATLMQPQEFESLREKLTQLPESMERPQLAKEDWLGALGVFLLVLLSMFPSRFLLFLLAPHVWPCVFPTVLLSHCCFWPVIRSDGSRNIIRGEQGW
jgi:hypothetical protein